MNNYELLFFMDSALTNEVREAVISKFVAIIEQGQGKVDTLDRWGVKKLAYPIAKKTDAYYVLINFQGKSDLPMEIQRVMNITDGVLRHMIIVK